jgi:hypothetical protein
MMCVTKRPANDRAANKTFQRTNVCPFQRDHGKTGEQTMSELIRHLHHHPDPAMQLKIRVGVLGEDPGAPAIWLLREKIKASPRAQTLLSGRDADGRIFDKAYHAYRKWTGAHWTLVDLAEIGYPAGDVELLPLRDQVYAWLFSEQHRDKIKTIDGRVRRCASQEGNALWATIKLGLTDDRTQQLVDGLLRWQWPDGGWNCDRNPTADTSSFMESLIPLRGLALYVQRTGDPVVARAVERATEVFLSRRLFRRRSDGSVIHPEFLVLHHPCYWHYDILFGLRVIAEAGFLNDPRCAEALDVLESKQLLDGGWPAEKKYYRVSDKPVSGRSLVDWGGASKRRMNEWVTAEALTVLTAVGRWRPS